jgi:hypothetical protein
VAYGVGLDDFAAGGDLHDVTDDRELHLATLECVADPVRRTREADRASPPLAPWAPTRSIRSVSRRSAKEAENQVVGAPCGIMDQVVVTMGLRARVRSTQ